MAGLVTPNSGHATFNGNKIKRKIASEIAYMPDADLFYPYFTVGATVSISMNHSSPILM